MDDNFMYDRFGRIINKSSDNDDELVKRQQSYYNGSNKDYKRSLLHPELHTAKIPSELPQETAVAALKYNWNITPNVNGKFFMVIDPFIKDNVYNNSSTLDGLGTLGSYTTVSNVLDTSIIDMWRLVSCCVVVQYIGRLDSHAGILTGCITSNLSNSTNDTFATFQNIEDIQNKQNVSPLDGLRILYCPVDTTMTDFNNTSVYVNNTHLSRWKNLIVVYGDGLPNTTCIRVDLYKNIEYVSKPAMREYISHDCAIASKLDADGINAVKSKQIQTLGGRQ